MSASPPATGTPGTPDAAAPPFPAPTGPVRWTCVPWDAVSRDALHAALHLRQLVFVVEQRCWYLDVDGRDPHAWHLFGWADDGTGAPALAAYARLFRPGLPYAEASIGRVITHPARRREALGRALLVEAIRRLVDGPDALAPQAPIRIGAQRYLERFYESFGFRSEGAPYDEDGIEHVEMVRPGGASAAAVSPDADAS